MIPARRTGAARAARRPLLGAALVLAAAPLVAAELLRARVEQHGATFAVHSEVRIALPAEQVRAILMRYRELPAVNDGIRRVEILAPARGGKTRMRVDSVVCIVFICLDYHWVQRVSTPPDGSIEARMEPAGSDFRSGWMRWRFAGEGTHSVMIFDARIEPGFWFPPIIGPWLIRRKLGREALEAAQGVERVAARLGT